MGMTGTQIQWREGDLVVVGEFFHAWSHIVERDVAHRNPLDLIPVLKL